MPDAAPTTPAPAPTPRSEGGPGERWVAGLLLVVLAAGFLALAAPRIAAPFGDSDEGINGAVWGLDSRALRERGPIDSALGGRRADGTTYASHPPLIVVTTATAEALAGESPAVTRASAWLATLAALGLLYLLARDLGVRPVAAAAAVVAATAGHLLVVYGPMLDTPVTSLPFGVATAIAFHRAWERRPLAPWLAGAVALGAALSGWQAALLAGLGAVALALATTPRGVAGLRRAAPLAVGTAVGGALSLLWGLWAYGGLDELGDKYAARSSGATGTSLVDLVDFQGPWLARLLGLSLLGVAACLPALRDRRFRPATALVLVTVASYTVLFRAAASGHQYWLYWLLVPATLGFAWLFGPFGDKVARDLRASPRARDVALVVVAVVVAAVNLAIEDPAGDLVDRGIAVVELAEAAPRPDDQEVLAYVGQPDRPDDWIAYELGLEPRALLGTDELEALAEEHPDHVVLVLGGCEPVNAGLCEALELPLLDGEGTAQVRTATAAALAAEAGLGVG